MNKYDKIFNDIDAIQEENLKSIKQLSELSERMEYQSDVLDNADAIISDLDKQFSEATGILNAKDLSFIFVATSLLCCKWIILSNIMPLSADFIHEVTPNDKRLDSTEMGAIDTKGKTKEEYQKTLERVKKNYEKLKEELEKCTSEEEREKIRKKIAANQKRQDELKKVLEFFDSNSKVAKTVKKLSQKKKDLEGKSYVKGSHISVKEIFTHPVPYDAMSKENNNTNLPVKLYGQNHHAYTLGHDPILGWIFGTLNIMTSSITLNTLTWPTYWVNPKGNKISSPTELGFLSCLFESVQSAQEDSKRIAAATVRHGLHMISDKYNKTGLPISIPFMTADNAQALIEKGWNSQEAIMALEKFSKTFVKDAAIVSIQFFASFIINEIIKAIHLMTYDPEVDGKIELYEVRTRKILSVANIIATSSNFAYVAISKNIKALDIGGAIETVRQIATNKKYIDQMKQEFISERFSELLLQKNSDTSGGETMGLNENDSIVAKAASEAIRQDSAELSLGIENIKKVENKTIEAVHDLGEMQKDALKHQYYESGNMYADIQKLSNDEKELCLAILKNVEKRPTFDQHDFLTALVNAFNYGMKAIPNTSPEIFESTLEPDIQAQEVIYMLLTYYCLLGDENCETYDSMPESYIMWIDEFSISKKKLKAIFYDCKEHMNFVNILEVMKSCSQHIENNYNPIEDGEESADDNIENDVDQMDDGIEEDTNTEIDYESIHLSFEYVISEMNNTRKWIDKENTNDCHILSNETISLYSPLLAQHEVLGIWQFKSHTSQYRPILFTESEVWFLLNEVSSCSLKYSDFDDNKISINYHAGDNTEAEYTLLCENGQPVKFVISQAEGDLFINFLDEMSKTKTPERDRRGFSDLPYESRIIIIYYIIEILIELKRPWIMVFPYMLRYFDKYEMQFMQDIFDYVDNKNEKYPDYYECTLKWSYKLVFITKSIIEILQLSNGLDSNLNQNELHYFIENYGFDKEQIATLAKIVQAPLCYSIGKIESCKHLNEIHNDILECYYYPYFLFNKDAFDFWDEFNEIYNLNKSLSRKVQEEVMEKYSVDYMSNFIVYIAIAINLLKKDNKSPYITKLYNIIEKIDFANGAFVEEVNEYLKSAEK